MSSDLDRFSDCLTPFAESQSVVIVSLQIMTAIFSGDSVKSSPNLMKTSSQLLFWKSINDIPKNVFFLGYKYMFDIGKFRFASSCLSVFFDFFGQIAWRKETIFINLSWDCSKPGSLWIYFLCEDQWQGHKDRRCEFMNDSDLCLTFYRWMACVQPLSFLSGKIKWLHFAQYWI